MSEKFWAIIKYKPKEGCEDEFREGLRRLVKMMEEKKDYDFINQFIKIDTGEFVQIVCMPDLDSLFDGQIDGLDWLDSVDHLLEKYEEESRTEAFSGFVVK